MVSHHVPAQPAPPPEASEPPGGDDNDQGGLAIMMMTMMMMTTMMMTMIVTMMMPMMVKIITSRVIGALGPRPLGGAPGAPGAPPPPAKVNIFILLLFAFSSPDFYFVNRLRLFLRSLCGNIDN